MTLDKLKTIPNWKNLSAKTQADIFYAYEKRLDSIGLFINNSDDLPVSALIQIAQSLAEPKHLGNLKTKEGWMSYSDNRYGKIIDNIAPYDIENRFTSYALASSLGTVDNLCLPPVLNFSPSNPVCSISETSPRLTKILDLYQSELQLDIKINEATQKSGEKYIIKHNKIALFGEKMSDFTKIILLNNIIAKQKVEEYLERNTTITELTSPLSEEQKKYVSLCIEKLLTLTLTRATDLGNSEISYKIDESLKREFFNTLGLLDGKRKDTIQYISQKTYTLFTDLVEKLGYTNTTAKIAANMEAMGFKYGKEPRTVWDAVSTINNLDKEFEITQKAIKETLDIDNTSSLVTASIALNGIGLGSKIINIAKLKQKVRNELPGYIKNSLLTKEQLNTFFESEEGALIKFIIDNNPKKYSAKAPLYIPEITAKVEENLVKGMINLTTAYIDKKQQEVPSKNSKRLLNQALNEEKETRSGNVSLIKKEFKAIVKDVVNANKNSNKKRSNVTPDSTPEV